MTIELTGLDYAEWERQAARLDYLIERAGQTGMLDAQHIADVERTEEEVADELMVVDDVRRLSDPVTARELLKVKRGLDALQQRLRSSRMRLRQLFPR